MSEVKGQYYPDHVSPPGVSLSEILESLEMTQAELAERSGRPRKTINGIIKGKVAITPETAIQFETIFGMPASFWNNRQRQYDEFQARRKEQSRLASQVEWLQYFPLNEMAMRGWVPRGRDKTKRLKNLLRFFGVASPEAWEVRWSSLKVSFRKSGAFEVDKYALATWLRAGELVADGVDCRPYDRTKFIESLSVARTFTRLDPEEFQPKLESLCAGCGVAVAFVREFPRIRVSGATRWLSHQKALIQLSLRYKTNDQLWHTFFHESCHILRHPKGVVFLESSGKKRCSDQRELEANKFAANSLIPGHLLAQFAQKHHPRISKSSIRAFARKIGIAPGIAVGQLQHNDYLDYSHCNELKIRLEWK